MFCFTSSFAFLLKNKDVFHLFIAWPNSASYCPRISIRHWHYSTDALQNSKLSSANNRWKMHTLFGQDNTPWISLFSVALLIILDKPSAHNKNRYGDNESPYFIPLDGWTKPLGSPFINIEYDAVHTVSIAKFTHLPSNPNFIIICLRKLHSTLSYALLISSFTAIWPFLPLLLLCILCNNSKAIVVLSVISLSSTKALWASDITFGKIIFNLFAITFEMILATTFSKLIGRKSDIYNGSFFFGISTICVKFILFSIWPEWRTDSTTLWHQHPLYAKMFGRKNGTYH